MQRTPDTDIVQMAARVERICGLVLARFADDGSGAQTPLALTEALHTLFQVLQRLDSDHRRSRVSLSEDELTDLAGQGQGLLDDLMRWGRSLGIAEVGDAIGNLLVPWSLWLARRGARLTQLEPLVNQLATLANRSSEAHDLQQLERTYSRLIAAVDPVLRRDIDKSNPQRPWRVLVLNRAIIATRTLDPDTMSAAFEALIHYLPEEAADFFSEGMREMDRVAYPNPVREVMQRYHRRWTASTLH